MIYVQMHTKKAQNPEFFGCQFPTSRGISTNALVSLLLTVAITTFSPFLVSKINDIVLIAFHYKAVLEVQTNNLPPKQHSHQLQYKVQLHFHIHQPLFSELLYYILLDQ